MRKFKNKLYYILVEKNHLIRSEYQSYVNNYSEYHANNRWESWLFLLKLNFYYRVLRKKNPILNKNSMYKKMSYINGPESDILKRMEFFHLANYLMQFDVISFDVFDTLIFRSFKKPTDLFYILAKRLNFTGFNEEFTTLRCKFEMEARKNSRLINNTTEINIYDIYKLMEKITNISVEIGVNTEVKTELDYCYANPYMLEVYKILRAQGKRIIITSDMYLTTNHIEKILKKNGFEGYEKIYVSSDYKKSKSTGELFDVIIADFDTIDTNKIMHIGDNKLSDIAMGNKKGLSTSYYSNVQEIGNRYRVNNMSKLIGSLYGGVVNTHLHNGIKKYSIYYEYGFIYMGIYVYGMAKWIYNKAKKENIDKVIFLSRDGSIYKQVFDMFYDDIETDYEYWSRNAAMRYSVVKRNYEEFICRYVDYRISSSNKDGCFIKMSDLLETLEIEELSPKLYNFDLKKDTMILEKNKKQIRKFLISNKSYIQDKYSKSEKKIQDIYKDTIGDSESIALVDTGWTGNNLINLKNMIKLDMGMDCKVKLLVAALKNDVNCAEITSGELDAYIFKDTKNRELFEKIYNIDNYVITTPLFEIGTQPTNPSFMYISEKEDFIFGVPIVEDYKILKSIEQGIIDFCKIYHKRSEKDQYLREISGYDAYIPFSIIANNKEYIEKNFFKLHTSFNIGSNSTNQKIETMEEYLKTYSMNRKG